MTLTPRLPSGLTLTARHHSSGTRILREELSISSTSRRSVTDTANLRSTFDQNGSSGRLLPGSIKALNRTGQSDDDRGQRVVTPALKQSPAYRRSSMQHGLREAEEGMTKVMHPQGSALLHHALFVILTWRRHGVRNGETSDRPSYNGEYSAQHAHRSIRYG